MPDERRGECQLLLNLAAKAYDAPWAALLRYVDSSFELLLTAETNWHERYVELKKETTDKFSTQFSFLRQIVDSQKEFFQKKGDSALPFVAVHAIPLQSADGYVQAVLVVGDIISRNWNDQIRSILVDVAKSLSMYFNEKSEEDDIRKKESAFMVCLEECRGGTWEIDLKNETIWVSDEAARLLETDFIGQIAVRDFVQKWMHPDDRLDFWEKFASYFRKSDHFRFECRMLAAKGGQVLYTQHYALVRKDPGGTPHKIYGIVIDGTEQVQRENELRESRERYQTLFDRSNDAIVLLENNSFFECNHKMLELFNVPDQETLRGMHPWDIAPEYQPNSERSKEQMQRIMRLSLESGGVNRYEWKARKFTGEEFDAMISLSRIPHAGQELQMMVLQDMTSQKKAANMFENYRAYLSVLAELRKFFFGQSEEETIQSFLVNMANHFGLCKVWYGEITKNEIVPKYHAGISRNYVDVERISLDPEANAPVFPLLTALRKNAYVILDSLDRNVGFAPWSGFVIGSRVRSMFAIPLEIDGIQEGGIVFYSSRLGTFHSTIIDYLQNVIRELGRILSEKRFWDEQEEALRRAKEYAERADQAKSRFLANMSHEIRTPLTAILGYTEMLAETNLDKDSKLAAVDVIRNNAEFLLQILNDVLDFSKIEADKLEIEIRKVSIVPILDEIAALYARKAKEKKLYFKISNTTPFPDLIHTDSVRLRQILLNLVSNAFKFTNKGGVEIVLSWIGRIGGSSGCLQIDVRDTGIGIPAKTISSLFSAFHQADSSTTRRFGGTGLGLAISQRLAEMLDGEIRLESEEGVGSTFSIRFLQQLPSNVRWLENLDDEQKEDRKAIEKKQKLSVKENGKNKAIKNIPDSPAKEKSADPSQLYGKNILLAEDGKDSRQLFELILSRCGARVQSVENGEEAFNEAMRAWTGGRPFDIVLMDMQMPVMDGYTATRKLREAGYSLPIVALTAHAMQEEMNRCFTAGCDDYANKPILRDALIEVVTKNIKKNDAFPSVDGMESGFRPIGWY